MATSFTARRTKVMVPGVPVVRSSGATAAAGNAATAAVRVVRAPKPFLPWDKSTATAFRASSVSGAAGVRRVCIEKVE